jgi:purine-binding chemotaxis protein CheW
LRFGGEDVSFIVDTEGEVMDVEAGSYADVPETVSGAIRPFLNGAYKLETALLLILDAERVASVTAS